MEKTNSETISRCLDEYLCMRFFKLYYFIKINNLYYISILSKIYISPILSKNYLYIVNISKIRESMDGYYFHDKGYSETIYQK